MKEIVFLANPFSPHIDRWVELVNSTGKEVMIIHVDNSMLPKTNTKTCRLLPRIFCKSKVMRYVLGGLILRYSDKYQNVDFFHAHNASGYGLMALISGKKFIVTTYGSEIYRVKESFSLYNLLIKKILSNAYRITCSTVFMKDFIVKKELANADKIYSSTLGVSKNFTKAVPAKIKHVEKKLDKRGLVLFSNRRIHPLYCIKYIVEEFAMIVRENPEVRLILLEGDAEKTYLEEIKKHISELNVTDNVIIVEGFISFSEIKWLYSVSSFSISIPKSDQLSSSILESIYCGVTPILRSLDAYNEIFENNLAYKMESQKIGSIYSAFKALVASKENKKNNKEDDKKTFFFSDSKVEVYINKLYSFYLT